MDPPSLPWLRDADYTSKWALAITAMAVVTTISYLGRAAPAIPTISGTIPRLSVTLLYMTDMKTFLSKAKCCLSIPTTRRHASNQTPTLPGRPSRSSTSCSSTSAR